MFPDAFTDGMVDFEVLKQLLGGTVEEREEKYGLTRHGKRQARQHALTPSTGTLRPCPEDSVDWNTTRNLMIEGDNLEVLKLVQKSYAGKVKLIHIDPPYNTGKDFVYPDDYRDSIRSDLESTGQTNGESRKLSSNTETSGRYHADWMSMIYPRLKVARNLLGNDGFTLMSIDENEDSHLRILCDELFGSENFLSTVTWRRKRESSNDGKGFAVKGEFLLAFGRGEEGQPNRLPLSESYLNSSYGIDHIRPDRSEQHILYELLLKLDLDLCGPIENRTVGGKSVHSVGAGTLISCLDKRISREDAETLALGIAEWRDELAPAGDTVAIFQDSAITDDVAKTNLAVILEQRGLGNVRSL